MLPRSYCRIATLWDLWALNGSPVFDSHFRKTEFKTFAALLKLLAGQGVVEFSVVLDDAKVISGGPLPSWSQPSLQHGVSRASWRHDFDLPF